MAEKRSLLKIRDDGLVHSGGLCAAQGTWADVSCVFTEGFGLAFPIVVASARSLSSLLLGLAALRLLRVPAE